MCHLGRVRNFSHPYFSPDREWHSHIEEVNFINSLRNIQIDWCDLIYIPMFSLLMGTRLNKLFIPRCLARLFMLASMSSCNDLQCTCNAPAMQMHNLLPQDQVTMKYPEINSYEELKVVKSIPHRNWHNLNSIPHRNWYNIKSNLCTIDFHASGGAVNK